MIPYLLAAVGGYLIGQSRKDEQYADGGRIKSYEKVEGTDYELKIEIYYKKGGMNYFSGKPEERGYYLSVSPVQVERRPNGITTESYTAFSGIKALILRVNRQSPKAEKEAEMLAQERIPELKNYVLGKMKEKGIIMADGGSIPNNYEGKTPKEVWDMEIKTELKKAFELLINELENTEDILVTDSHLAFIRDFIEKYISEGQYASGGYMYEGGGFNHNDIKKGDFVNFGSYGNYYVADTDYDALGGNKYFWVVKEEKNRKKSSASGKAMLKSNAKYIVEEYAKGGYMAKGGVVEHGLRKGDKIVSEMYNIAGVINEDTGEAALVDIETGKREEIK